MLIKKFPAYMEPNFFLLQLLSLAFCIHYTSSYQKVEIYNSVNCSFLLLFLWLYNSLCRVLAFSTNSSHLLLSWTRVLQFGTFDFCIFFLTSSSQHIFGLPVGLLEKGFQEHIAFFFCIFSMWPRHPSLCALMKFIMYLCFIILSNSWFVFFH